MCSSYGGPLQCSVLLYFVVWKIRDFSQYATGTSTFQWIRNSCANNLRFRAANAFTCCKKCHQENYFVPKKSWQKKVILAPNDSEFKSHVNSKSLKLQERCQAYNKSDSRWLTDRHRQTMTMEADHEVLITDELTSTCWETCHVLPGIKGTSWPQASLRRTIMKRGVAPDHVPRIMMLTVLASLKVKLKKQIKNKQLNIGYIAGNSLTHVNTNRKGKKKLCNA